MDLRLCHNQTQMWKRFLGDCGISEGWSCQGSIISLVLSYHNKNLKPWTLKPSVRHSSQTDHVNGSQTDQFYLEKKKNTSSRLEDMPTQKTRRKRARARAGDRETPGPLAPLFICFFLPLGLPYVNWASQECCLLLLRSSLRSLDLPLIYVRWLFPSLSFSHRHSGLLFPILTT